MNFNKNISFQQELSKKQQQLEQAHSMLLRHHEKTQDLEYRQQKSVHALREDQVSFRRLSSSLSHGFSPPDQQTARERAKKSKGLHGAVRAGAFA